MKPAARSLALLLVVLAPFACALPRYGKPPPDPAGALFIFERDLFAAIEKKDAATLWKLLAEEFKLRVPGSPEVDRLAFITSVQGLKGSIEVTGDGLDARVLGEIGIITGVQRSHARLEDGRVVDDVQAFTDVAVLREGRWQLVLAHSAPLGR